PRRSPGADGKGGAPRGELDAPALKYPEPNRRHADKPPKEYSQFAPEGGRRKLLYYPARHMEKSCIGCHNHRDSRSPKKDWKEGDVVGVLKIVRPLDHEIDSTREGLRGAFALMGTISTALLVISVVVMVVAQRRRKGDSA